MTQEVAHWGSVLALPAVAVSLLAVDSAHPALGKVGKEILSG